MALDLKVDKVRLGLARLFRALLFFALSFKYMRFTLTKAKCKLIFVKCFASCSKEKSLDDFCTDTIQSFASIKPFGFILYKSHAFLASSTLIFLLFQHYLKCFYIAPQNER